MKKTIQKFLINRGIRIERAWPGNDYNSFLSPSYDMLLGDLFHRVKEPSIVVIGANDGLDPLFAWLQIFRADAIFVEPLPDIFNRLKHNYADLCNAKFENACVYINSGIIDFYRLKPNYASLAKGHLKKKDFNDRISSLTVEHILNHVGYTGNWQDIIHKVPVDAISFDDLLKKYNIRHIDLLQIDAEGYDFEILKMINFGHIKPKILCFEYINLSGESYSKALSLITKFGYKWTHDKYNIIAQHDT